MLRNHHCYPFPKLFHDAAQKLLLFSPDLGNLYSNFSMKKIFFSESFVDVRYKLNFKFLCRVLIISAFLLNKKYRVLECKLSYFCLFNSLSILFKQSIIIIYAKYMFSFY